MSLNFLEFDAKADTNGSYNRKQSGKAWISMNILLAG